MMKHQSHMQHVLTGDESLNTSKNSSFRPRESAAPDLEDSPLQKDFIVSMEEFEHRIITAAVLSLVVVAIGILGTFLSKSTQL